jgi:hypothetical protein
MVLAIGDLSSRCSPPRSPLRQHSSPVQVAYGNLCPIEIEVAVRLGWSGMASPETTVLPLVSAVRIACGPYARSRSSCRAAGLVGNGLAIDGRADVQKDRDVLRGGGTVACVMHLRRQDQLDGDRLATIEINGAQRIVHRRPSPANFVLPWRRRAP